jgi:hypothetical protein
MAQHFDSLDLFAQSLHQPRQITGLFIDVQNETVSVKTLEHNLNAFRQALGCHTIDMTERCIGVLHGRRFTIICDDEALCADRPKISAIDNMGNAQLCGNLFLVNFDGVEDVESLSPDDIAYLNHFVLLQGTRNYPKPYPMLHQCEYAR